MSFEIHEVRQAYIKLKSYIYYDNTDLLLRRQLVEFETNRTKDILGFLNFGSDPYNFDVSIFDMKVQMSVERKLERLTNELNNYHKDPKFFDFFLGKIKVNFYPKKIEEPKEIPNFITNQRTRKKYSIERITPFIDAPIELHIISVLWILKYGVALDATFPDSCLGNRLVLNKEKTQIAQGSGLFKPYFKQYQRWRDESVSVAKNLLKKNKNVLFLNLDIRDYFHSVRIPVSKLNPEKKNRSAALRASYNLRDIFTKVHCVYSEQVSAKYNAPYNFKLEQDSVGELLEVILPIGLLSSYVLANDYLLAFDSAVHEKLKPAYFGRYVDDILFVISDPIVENEENESYEPSLSKIETYVRDNFSSLISIVSSPPHIRPKDLTESEIHNSFQLNEYDTLFCQSEKSLLYFFDHTESDLVIDKLKKELDERTSEFRDFPDEEDNNNSFEESAYHLMYDGTEGKIRTLKDYKENRYGLAIYLTNRIFSALRHEKKITDEERDQVLHFFRGSTCLNFYRLWERIFTFFLVNDQAKAYVEFYLHCVEQIDRFGSYQEKISKTKVEYDLVRKTLIDYLDCCHELALSLNPYFINKTQEAARNFEFEINKHSKSTFAFFSPNFEPTKPDSYWIRRFRETNLIRHQYVIHPLLSYTEGAKKGWLELTGLSIDFNSYKLDNDLVENSPRPVKFWECCLAVGFEEISAFTKVNTHIEDDFILTDILGLYKGEFDPEHSKAFHLHKAFDLYRKINQNHIPSYIMSDKKYQSRFYDCDSVPVHYDKLKEVKIQEIRVNSQGTNNLSNPVIAFANTEVTEENIVSGLRGKPNISADRYSKWATILKKARKEKPDILLFPEFFMPINLLSSLARYSEKNQILTITGLEHTTVGNAAFNFVITILPFDVEGIKDATVVFRLKNHYAHIEELLIRGNHFNVPKPSPYRYDLFNWRNLYFSVYYCYEIADALHKSLFKSKIDLLVSVEWNKDTNYFSNIVESITRDLHVYVAQVNTSQFGDSRLTQPVESAKRDILKLKGGKNDAILVAQIDIPKLREFQRKKFALTHTDKEFKPLPPDFYLEDVLKRINNKNVL